MRSPKDMQTIQIDITNACNKICSNCTRFCGNHKTPFFMDFETFKKAVDSLKGYDGVIGVMGGEPTLHPQFEQFARYLDRAYKDWNKTLISDGDFEDKENRMIYPQNEFIKEIHRREFNTHHIHEHSDGHKVFMMSGPGLWSNMGITYRKYYELIQDVFPVQFLNDHVNPSYHQPGLIARQDLGIADEDWIKLRDNCWIQNEWSATITPKGAFFCEVAGALDMLFDGPGGWPIESGWWNRNPEDFRDQLHWCEICGFALNTFMRDANDEVDDVSSTLYEMLKKVDSPKMKNGQINKVYVIDKKLMALGHRFSVAQPYIEHYEDRFNKENSHLFIEDFELVERIDVSEGFGTVFINMLQSAHDWILYMTRTDVKKSVAEAEIRALTRSYIFNPGTLHLGKGFAFFSKNAIALKELKPEKLEKFSCFEDIIQNWGDTKIVKLSELKELLKWNRKKIIPGMRYIIWGAGFSGAFFADAVSASGGILVGAIDSDPGKLGNNFYGVSVSAPDDIRELSGSYDYILIAHYSRFEEIQQQAIELGVSKEIIILPCEV